MPQHAKTFGAENVHGADAKVGGNLEQSGKVKPNRQSNYHIHVVEY